MKYDVILKGSKVHVLPSGQHGMLSFDEVHQKIERLNQRVVVEKILLGGQQEVALDYFSYSENEAKVIAILQKFELLNEQGELVESSNIKTNKSSDSKQFVFSESRVLVLSFLICSLSALCVITFGGYEYLSTFGWHEYMLEKYPNFSKKFEVFYGNDPKGNSFKYLVSYAWAFPIGFVFGVIFFLYLVFILKDFTEDAYWSEITLDRLIFCTLLFAFLLYLVCASLTDPTTTNIRRWGRILYRSNFIGLSLLIFCISGMFCAFLMFFSALVRSLFFTVVSRRS